MRAPVARSLGLSVVLATALALAAPPSSASEPFNLRAVAGIPETSLGVGRGFAWRNVGIAAEGTLLDVEAKVARCVDSVSTNSTSHPVAAGHCAGAFDTDGTGSLGHQFGLVLKVPQWHGDAPWIDVTLRSWRGAVYRAGTGNGRGAGSAAGMTVTQPLGSFDAVVGYSAPIAPSRGQGVWRSTFAGLAWRPARSMTLELIADRGVDVAGGTIDRTLTLKMWEVLAERRLRLAVWATRALDDPTDRVRVGAGLDLEF